MRSTGSRLIVLTGGPGTGKTTVLTLLADAGFPVMPESARAILRAHHGTPSPEEFALLMLRRDRMQHRLASRSRSTVFFDRGLGDILGHLRLHGRPVPHELRHAARTLRYDHVVVAAPWPEIYTADTERTQTFDEAVESSRAVTSAYEELGYRPCALPHADVATRARFLLRWEGEND
ncbi:AAA family ATPase [Allosaccharopolyspora coralli]|uniref:AAA family ATPase n=1 Tax=Allosaccharopolyspora coralli TaxID=2665642 RepID=A0A5Q3Q6F1_9PSEU|nr:AAA family ATPase [Allosaccharopolyspora coralli]QGK70042.1 AAA family ATPase [Allosaccharopolyspora coralli]